MDSANFSEENPYAPNNALVPFAGREDAFAHLQNHLNNPQGTDVALFYGRDGIGKTALLKQVPVRFDAHYVVVDVPLNDDTLRDEGALMQTLAIVLVEAVMARGFVVLDPLELPETDHYTWLLETGLPALYRAIRPHRHFIVLIDDAHLLLNAIDDGRLSVAVFDALNTLLNPQLGMGLTLPEAYEGAIALFAPLTSKAGARRLTILADDAIREILLMPVQTQYTLNDEALDAVCMATGGDPAMVQRYGFYIYERATEKREPFSQITITVEDIKAIHDTIYAEWSPIFQDQWQALAPDERLFLHIAGNVYYDNPVKPLSIDRMVAWTVETDHPTDSTAFSALFRGLEYQGLVGGKASDLRFASTLMRRWVLEKPRLNVTAPSRSTQSEDAPNINLMWVAVIVFLVVVGVLLALNLTGGGTPDPVPTLPLVPTST